MFVMQTYLIRCIRRTAFVSLRTNTLNTSKGCMRAKSLLPFKNGADQNLIVLILQWHQINKFKDICEIS